MNKTDKTFIKQFRNEFDLFDTDINKMSDKEVIEGVKEMTRLIGSFKATKKEAEKIRKVFELK